MTTLPALASTIQKLAVRGKGILAADESTPTITKRFQALGIESTEDSRRAYREMLMTTPGCKEFIAGVILFDETLDQMTSKGISFPQALLQQDILPGIKVDKGLVPLVNLQNTSSQAEKEEITQGLDGLSERLAVYKNKGARFAKWRAVYHISSNTPSALAISTNAAILARYAAICQQQDIVPIVEPEILIDGDHTLARCEEVSVPVFHAVFEALYRHHVKLNYIVLKPSMVISGKTCAQKSSVQETAEATLRVLLQTVPAATATINFLSGGQTALQATAHLNAMNQTTLPWNLSFSYARALQEDAMKIWAGKNENVAAAQAAFYKRAKLNSLAAKGEYTDALEKENVSLVA